MSARRRIPLAPYLFLLPFAVLFVAFLLAPLAYALGLSLFRDSMVGGRAFVALANYADVLTDGAFWGGIGTCCCSGCSRSRSCWRWRWRSRWCCTGAG